MVVIFFHPLDPLFKWWLESQGIVGFLGILVGFLGIQVTERHRPLHLPSRSPQTRVHNMGSNFGP